MRFSGRVPFSERTRVTGSRALDTVYQNTSGKFMHVDVTLICRINAAGVEYAWGNVYIDDDNPPVVPSQKLGYYSLTNNQIGNQMVPVTFIVPPNYYYEIEVDVSANGVVTIAEWSETV